MPLCHVHRKQFPVEAMQEHHVVPQAYGGADGPTVWLCSSCHDLTHRSALKLYAKKGGEARDMVDRFLPNAPAAQERMWKLVHAIANARQAHARSAEIPEAGIDATDVSTVKMSLEIPDWLHHRLKTLAVGTGLYRYVLQVLENHALVATQKPGASAAELYGVDGAKTAESEPTTTRLEFK